MKGRRVARVCHLASALFALMLAADCRGGSGPTIGSETNFLRSCDGTCEDGLSCICGVCTSACSDRDECTSFCPGAECVAQADRGADLACAAADSGSFCDLPCSGETDCTSLGEQFRCQDGYCRVPEETSCPATTLPVGDSDGSVDVDGTTRTYVVHVPNGFTGTEPVPLVLDFHTLGGTPNGEAANSGYAELADQEGFIVAWPLGIEGAWNIGPCCTTSRDVDDVGFARAIVEQIQTQACVDPKRVYAVGVANGGGMAYQLACNAADVFAAIAPSAFDLLSDLQQPCEPERPLTVISFRGRFDPLVPYEGGTEPAPNGLGVDMEFRGAEPTFQWWADFDGCTGDPSAADANGCSTYSDCADGVEVTLCTSEGGMEWGSAEIGWATLSRHSLP